MDCTWMVNIQMIYLNIIEQIKFKVNPHMER